MSKNQNQYVISRMMYVNGKKHEKQPILGIKSYRSAIEAAGPFIQEHNIKVQKIFISPEDDYIIIREKHDQGNNVDFVAVIERFNEESVY